MVMYDLVERDFRIHPGDPPLTAEFKVLQHAVMASRTKVMAAMARLRIKHEANSMNNLLPENLRHQHRIDKNPLYIWVNLKKNRFDSILRSIFFISF